MSEEILRFLVSDLKTIRIKQKVSNEEWESKTDPDSRVTMMKDGRTHLAYKAEHTIDLETEFVLDASRYTAVGHNLRFLGGRSSC